MNIKIQYNIKNNKNIPKKLFLKIINSILIENNNLYILNIKIVGKKEIKKLNFKFKGINKPTNTLTFHMNLKTKKKNIIFCDMAICKSILEKEAKLYNRNLYFHWSHIIVHNCLHLIGFNHNDKVKSNIMKNKEIEILKKFNIPNPHIINLVEK